MRSYLRQIPMDTYEPIEINGEVCPTNNIIRLMVDEGSRQQLYQSRYSYRLWSRARPMEGCNPVVHVMDTVGPGNQLSQGVFIQMNGCKGNIYIPEMDLECGNGSENMLRGGRQGEIGGIGFVPTFPYNIPVERGLNRGFYRRHVLPQNHPLDIPPPQYDPIYRPIPRPIIPPHNSTQIWQPVSDGNTQRYYIQRPRPHCQRRPYVQANCVLQDHHYNSTQHNQGGYVHIDPNSGRIQDGPGARHIFDNPPNHQYQTDQRDYPTRNHPRNHLIQYNLHNLFLENDFRGRQEQNTSRDRNNQNSLGTGNIQIGAGNIQNNTGPCSIPNYVGSRRNQNEFSVRTTENDLSEHRIPNDFGGRMIHNDLVSGRTQNEYGGCGRNRENYSGDINNQDDQLNLFEHNHSQDSSTQEEARSRLMPDDSRGVNIEEDCQDDNILDVFPTHDSPEDPRTSNIFNFLRNRHRNTPEYPRGISREDGLGAVGAQDDSSSISIEEDPNGRIVPNDLRLHQVEDNARDSPAEDLFRDLYYLNERYGPNTQNGSRTSSMYGYLRELFRTNPRGRHIQDESDDLRTQDESLGIPIQEESPGIPIQEESPGIPIQEESRDIQSNRVLDDLHREIVDEPPVGDDPRNTSNHDDLRDSISQAGSLDSIINDDTSCRNIEPNDILNGDDDSDTSLEHSLRSGNEFHECAIHGDSRECLSQEDVLDQNYRWGRRIWEDLRHVSLEEDTEDMPIEANQTNSQ